MVKVTIEKDGEKKEITGEFFAGFAFTKTDETEEHVVHEARTLIYGNTNNKYISCNIAKSIARMLEKMSEDKFEYAVMMIELAELISKETDRVLEEDADEIADAIRGVLKGEKE